MAVRVLIVDAKPARSQRLEAALREAGFDVLMTVDEQDDLSARVEQLEPDAVIVDAELPSRDTLENLGQVGRHYPRPMIMMAQNEAPDMTREAARAGVSTYVVDGVAPSVMRSLVDMAIEHFQAHRQLKCELDRTQRTLAERKAIDRAKCVVMERHGVGEQAAYRRLRKMAMDQRMSLSDLAHELLRTQR